MTTSGVRQIRRIKLKMRPRAWFVVHADQGQYCEFVGLEIYYSSVSVIKYSCYLVSFDILSDSLTSVSPPGTRGCNRSGSKPDNQSIRKYVS